MSDIHLYINKKDRTSYLFPGSTRWTNSILSDATLKFQLRMPKGQRIAISDFDKIELHDDSYNGLVFKGYVSNREDEIIPGSDILVMNIECEPWSKLIYKRAYDSILDVNLDLQFKNKTCGYYVKMMIDRFLKLEYGFYYTGTSIEDGVLLDNYNPRFGLIGKTFDELAEMSGYSWWADDNGCINFRQRPYSIAPYEATEDEPNFINLKVKRTNEDYAIQVTTSGDMISYQTKTDTFLGAYNENGSFSPPVTMVSC